MSAEQKTPSKASGSAWSDVEKIAYLIILGDLDGKMEGKVTKAPMPEGRSVISCQRFLTRLREKYIDDIEKIKNGMPILAAESDTNCTVNASSEKTKTPRKRKPKAEDTADVNDDLGASPKKKAGGRKKKVEVAVKEEEDIQDEIMKDASF